MVEAIPKWSAEDERRLQELTDRKAQRAYQLTKRVIDVADEIHIHNMSEDEIAEGMIKNARHVCAVLHPFVEGPFRAVLLEHGMISYKSDSTQPVTVELAEWTPACAIKELHASGFISDKDRDNNTVYEAGNVFSITFPDGTPETLTLVRLSEGEGEY
jgi:hypothetical protein